MKKTCTKNLGVVEAQVDEFTVVFRPREESVVSLWTAMPAVYLSRVNNFIEDLSKLIGLELFGGLGTATAQAGYNVGLATRDGSNSVRVSYHTDYPKQGVCVRFGGRGLKSYMRVTGLALSDVVAKLYEVEAELGWAVRFTRLDVAIDVLNGPHTVGHVDGKLSKGLWELRRPFKYGRKNKETVVRPGKLAVSMETRKVISGANGVQTAYYGRTERTMLRVYDKRSEQLAHNDPMYREKAMSCESWVRFEAVFRKDDADACGRAIYDNKLAKAMPEHELFADLFTDRFNLFNVSTQDYVGWWRPIVGGKVKPPLVPVKDADSWRDLERSRTYFVEGDSGLGSLIRKMRHQAEADYYDEKGLEPSQLTEEHMKEAEAHVNEVVEAFLRDVHSFAREAEDGAGVKAWKRRFDVNRKAEKAEKTKKAKAEQDAQDELN